MLLPPGLISAVGLSFRELADVGLRPRYFSKQYSHCVFSPCRADEKVWGLPNFVYSHLYRLHFSPLFPSFGASLPAQAGHGRWRFSWLDFGSLHFRDYVSEGVLKDLRYCVYERRGVVDVLFFFCVSQIRERKGGKSRSDSFRYFSTKMTVVAPRGYEGDAEKSCTRRPR